MVNAGPAPYNPNSKRIAEMIQNDWAKVGVKAKIVSYEWGEYLAGMRKGDTTAPCMAGCRTTAIRTTLLAHCSAVIISRPAPTPPAGVINPMTLVKKALLVSDPQARAKLYEQAQEIFLSAGAMDHPGDRENLLCDAQQRQRLPVSMMGSDFSKAKLN